jgi:hypothetical protein
MDLDMQHGHGNAAFTWTCSIYIDMQHGHEHAALAWTRSIYMDMQHGHGYAAWTWTCKHGHVKMNMDMQ